MPTVRARTVALAVGAHAPSSAPVSAVTDASPVLAVVPTMVMSPPRNTRFCAGERAMA